MFLLIHIDRENYLSDQNNWNILEITEKYSEDE